MADLEGAEPAPAPLLATDRRRHYVLLRLPIAPTTSSHTVDDFVGFCVGKVDKIRQATSGAPPPVIQTRHVAQFSHFSPVTSKEIINLLAVVPSKCCSLDPLPTWIIKKLKHVFTPILCSLVQFFVVEWSHTSQSEAWLPVIVDLGVT